MKKLEIIEDLPVKMLVGEYPWIRECAHAHYNDYLKRLSIWQSKIEERLAAASGIEEQLRNSAVSWEYRDELSALHRSGDAAFLFSAMAVEGLLNFYGVLKLGTYFFKQYLQMLTAPNKAGIILAICHKLELSKDDKLYKNIAKIMENRNRFVHPKTIDFIPDRKSDNGIFSASLEEKDFIKEFIECMEEIHGEFIKIDPKFKYFLEIGLPKTID